MWSKHDKDNLYTMDGDESFTFLGKGAQFKGIIHFEGTIRIDGRLEGEIHTKGTLMVGEHAVIEGDIHADVVVSGGQINGNIVASEKVQLLSTGIVTGTIKTPLLSVEEGVRLHGMCDAEGRGAVRALDGAREAAQRRNDRQQRDDQRELDGDRTSAPPSVRRADRRLEDTLAESGRRGAVARELRGGGGGQAYRRERVARGRAAGGEGPRLTTGRGSATMKKTVVVGMSGGVDSSVAAALLVGQGYQVQGVTLQTWEPDDNATTSKKWQERGCCKIGLARFVAQQLDIPHQVLDIRERFRSAVVQDFIDGYSAGLTPNPCVRCNERVKFGCLMDAAWDMGADYVATGHYARLLPD